VQFEGLLDSGANRHRQVLQRGHCLRSQNDLKSQSGQIIARIVGCGNTDSWSGGLTSSRPRSRACAPLLPAGCIDPIRKNQPSRVQPSRAVSRIWLRASTIADPLPNSSCARFRARASAYPCKLRGLGCQATDSSPRSSEHYTHVDTPVVTRGPAAIHHSRSIGLFTPSAPRPITCK
jgi:hypothetical protein